MPSDAAAACRPWKGEHPTAAAALLARCLAAGVVSQETLDLTCRKTPCFVKLSEMEKIADIQAEIDEVQPEVHCCQCTLKASILRDNTWHR
uniref:Uncharacterized protein n=1 Tax=Falco tinnunculus TaxID=100819 RepID=A0A8C4XQA6_FALTI